MSSIPRRHATSRPRVRSAGAGLVGAGALLAATACGGGGADGGYGWVHTDEVARFWTVVDSAGDGDLVGALEAAYLTPGSRGLREFLAAQGVGAGELARVVREQEGRYEAIRPVSSRAAETAPAIAALYRDLRARYPGAVLPEVHFVMGALGAGGGATDAGLVIAAEMAARPEDYLLLVAHELAHAQQPRVRAVDPLLVRALREGVADLVAEILTGRRIRSRTFAYGYAHEERLWEEFQEVMWQAPSGRWLDPRAWDPVRRSGAGYFLGYRIARSFWERVQGRETALEDLLRWRDPESFLATAAYDPGPLSRVLATARRQVSNGEDRPLRALERVDAVETVAQVRSGVGIAESGAWEARVRSRRGGSVRMIRVGLPDGSAPDTLLDVRVGFDSEWIATDSGRVAEVDSGMRSWVRGHEWHALALFPETRLFGPEYLGRVAWTPADREVLGIRWTTNGSDTLVVHYDPRDTLPLGVSLRWLEPAVDVVFGDWVTHESGVRLFRTATRTQGDERTRFAYGPFRVTEDPRLR